MSKCPNCKCKIGKGTGNKRTIVNGSSKVVIHKRCPGTPKKYHSKNR